MPFLWKGDCKSYQVQIAADEGFASIEKDTLVKSTGFNYRPNRLNHTYFWKVKCGTNSQSSYFKVPKGVIKVTRPTKDSTFLPLSLVSESSLLPIFDYERRCDNTTVRFTTDSLSQGTGLNINDFVLVGSALDPGSVRRLQFLSDATYYLQAECPLYFGQRRLKTHVIQGGALGIVTPGGLSVQAELKSLGKGKMQFDLFPTAVVLTQDAPPAPYNINGGALYYTQKDGTRTAYAVLITISGARPSVHAARNFEENIDSGDWHFRGTVVAN